MRAVLATAAETARRAPRWLTLTLLASLALNLAVVGVAAGSYWAFRHGGFWGGGGFGASMLGYASQLPPERRGQLWKATAEQRQGLRPHWREVGQARREALAALTAEPFDPPRFAAAQARVHEAETKARGASQALIVEMAARMTPDERRALSRLRGPHHRGGRGHSGDMQLEEPAAEAPKAKP